uniref:Ubiquinol-cytochrome c reductase complex 9.5 kDa protein n=1 Tax=Sinocyclocheilus anshuiensis TaxID=1608454 RepID=A0A671P730_9TELE
MVALENYFSFHKCKCFSTVYNIIQTLCMTKLFYKPASLFTAMVLMYLTYTWGNRVHEQSKRKNLEDYENDQ